MFTSLQQCHACRLTWFPRGENAACPACGGTKLGGALGIAGWLFRHGPLSERVTPPEPAAAHAALASDGGERRADAHAPAKKTKSDKVNVKRRQKKAKTRSKHVQR
jgi:hypothetical protein